MRLQIEQKKSTFLPDSEEYEALTALERELLFRREASLRSQIRILVRNTLKDNPNVSELAKRAVEIYDLRSTLVHEGKLPEQELVKAENTAREVVEMVLKAKFHRS